MLVSLAQRTLHSTPRCDTADALLQASLSRVGIDPTAALERARSQSRGRKRTRSEAPADVEMADAEVPKRIHSSKSRFVLIACYPGHQAFDHTASAKQCRFSLQQILLLGSYS